VHLPFGDVHSPTPSVARQQTLWFLNLVHVLFPTQAQLPFPVFMQRRKLSPAVLQHGAAAGHTPLSCPQRQLGLF
jgi:hypothetical protein